MKIFTAHKCWCLWFGCWLLLSCGGREATPTANESAAAQVPAIIQSSEPVMTETVSRIFNRSCQSCHGPDGRGIAAVAPNLRRAKPRTEEQWQQYLNGSTGATGTHPGAQMPPPTWLNADEIKVMAAYLVSLNSATPAAR